MKRDFNCGTGSGGFEPGNTCAGGGGGGGGDGGGGAGGSSGGGDAETGPRSERLRDRIEGTDAEVKYEQRQIERKIDRLTKKIEAIDRKDAEATVKILKQKADEAGARAREYAKQAQAATERINAAKAQLKAMRSRNRK